MRFKSNVLVYTDGTIIWLPPAIYQSSCQIDVTYFPFDQQRCVMKFGSWTFNGDQVALALYNNIFHVDLSDYWKSGTWDIVDVPAYLNVHNNSKYNQPTETDISFHITIRRKTLFYTVNLILPTVLISFLCILVFYLPSEAGKFSFPLLYSFSSILLPLIFRRFFFTFFSSIYLLPTLPCFRFPLSSFLQPIFEFTQNILKFQNFFRLFNIFCWALSEFTEF